MNIDKTFKAYDIVTPEEGKWLFNGEGFSNLLYTPKNADLSSWREVDNTFKEQWEAEHQPEE